MSRYIPETIRKAVAVRAQHRCEYCRIYARYSYLAFHIEHIVSLKHGGESGLENLAYSCPICNINKGSDIATFLDSNDQPIRFFNPRKDIWGEHFMVETSGFIIAQTAIAEATIKIFNLNHPDSIIERSIMIQRKIF